MKIHSKSAWTEDRIISFLNEAVIPMRIACNGSDGYPVVCSLWFTYRDGALWSASHKNSHVVKQLKANPQAGLEIATNDYPYHGVRGRGDAQLLTENVADVLQALIRKYLGVTNQPLADWLMSRVDDEYAIKITPTLLNSWDFSDRMQKS